MTTLDAMVVGTHPVKMMPTSRASSMKAGFVAQRLTTAKATAEVRRKDCACTNRWTRQRW